MKRRLVLNASLALLIVSAGLSYSACSKPDDPGTAGPQPSFPTPLRSPSGTTLPDIKGGLHEITASEAMIVRVERDVSLKAKGASDYVRILHGMFRDGDTLQVGEQSKAWVACVGLSVCPLGKGLYSECCKIGCDGAIKIPPPANSESQTRMIFISKNQLPAAEMQMLKVQETSIRNLGAHELTTRFLMADLYSAWKLVEAKEEVKNLSWELNTPGAKDELKLLYAPMLRKTGDIQLRMSLEGEAEDSYKKAVELGYNDPREKADARVSLGQFYELRGQKEKAVTNLKLGQQLYEKDGDEKRAAATKQAIANIEKP